MKFINILKLISFEIISQVDENYVADPPKTEVTIENLNDNVDPQFLRNMTAKFGPIEELTIHIHPLTRKHLGLAR